ARDAYVGGEGIEPNAPGDADLTAVGGLRRCSNRERPTDGPRRPRDHDVDPGEVERRPRVHHVIAPGHSTVLHDEFANGDLHGRRLVLARRGGGGGIGAGSKWAPLTRPTRGSSP